MKTYLRIVSFARPNLIFVPQYLLVIFLSVLFGLVNFTLFIPLLNILFGTVDLPSVPLEDPSFSLSVEFVKNKFNFIFLGIIQQHGQIAALKFVCIAAVLSILLKNVFRYLAMIILAIVRTGVIKGLRDAIFLQLIQLDSGFFTENKKGDLVSRMTNDVQEIENSVISSFTVIFREPITIAGYFTVLFIMSFQLTAFTLLILPFSALIISTIIKKLKKHATQTQQILGAILGSVDETITGIKVIKAFNTEENMVIKFNKKTAQYANALKRMLFKQYSASPISETLSVTVVAAIMLYGGSLVLKDESSLTASEFITYIILFSQIMSPAKAISTAFSNIQRGLVGGERIFEILDSQPEIQNCENATELTSFSSEIEFREVYFQYEKGRDVLKGINFKVSKGQRVALVGPSGGGKSTIADLIPRFYDPTEGAVFIDGQNIKSLKAASLRKFMGVVTQESILFHDTIFNNIAFGMEDVSKEAVVKAAKIANAHNFILKTEKGYDTIIGDRGDKLSGGQRQRLSIARAVLKNPEILILDEATSSLDAESEKLVQEALNNLLKNRTSIVIAHRLSTIQSADEILVIAEGNIVERGTHEELKDLEGGLYQRLSLMQ